MRPPLSVPDERYKTWGHIRNDGKRIGAYAFQQQAADIDHLFGCQLAMAASLSSQINKTCFPLVLCVLRKRDPLKIFWSIIGFNAVDVVDRKPFFKALNKRHSYKAVHEMLDANPIFSGGNFQVSVFGYALRKCLGLVGNGDLLRPAVFYSRIGSSVRGGANRAVLMNNPIKTFGVNYLVHVGILT